MDMEELLDRIAKGEDSTIQFKSNISNSVQLAQEMVAFLNTRGGVIIIGLDDNATITGLSRPDIKRLNQLVSNCATENVRPPVNPLVEIFTIEGRNVMAVIVPEGASKPYCTNEGVYFAKVGADKRKMSQEELRRAFQESGGLYADEAVVNNTSITDIDQELFRAFLKKKFRKDINKTGMDMERVLENLNLAKKGVLTLAGLLLFAENPQKSRPVCTIKAVSFVGNDISGTAYRDKEDLEGNIPALFKGAMSFVSRNLRKIQKGKGFNVIGTMEVPLETLEELVVNALVHRDYSMNTPVKIFIFDDRIEITNPGSLPNCLTVENIKSGISVARNPVLHSIAQYLVPYSGLGSGIARALSKYKDIEFVNDRETNIFTAIIQRR